MPVFRYKAVAADGRMTYGEIDAPSRSIAISRLQSSGHLPISADEVDKKKERLRKLLSIFRRSEKVRNQDVIALTRELATLLQAGLPLDSALQTLSNVSTAMPVKSMVKRIQERVRSGLSLSSAMAEHDRVFNRLYLNMVRAGEAGGSLSVVIDRIAGYLERSGELRASIITALIYPAILVVIALLSLLVLMTFIVPQFVPLFEDAGQALPLITQIVFTGAQILRDYWWAFLIIFTAAIWYLDRQLQNPAFRARFDTGLLKLPRAGTLIAQMEMARFSRTLGTLLNNGVPLLTGVGLVKDVITNTTIAKLIDRVATSLEQGQRMAQPLKAAGYIPSLAVQLIEVGEESGQLESMLLKIADIYDREIQATVKRMLALLEPVIILLLGGMIAVIILSILLALVGLNDTIG